MNVRSAHLTGKCSVTISTSPSACMLNCLAVSHTLQPFELAFSGSSDHGIFLSQEYWNGLSFPLQDLSDWPRNWAHIPVSPSLQVDLYEWRPSGSPAYLSKWMYFRNFSKIQSILQNDLLNYSYSKSNELSLSTVEECEISAMRKCLWNVLLSFWLFFWIY